MARRIESKFLIIEGLGSEFLSIGMGFGNIVEKKVNGGFFDGVSVFEVIGGGSLCCDDCNEIILPKDTCYYVAVLNRLFCKKCFDGWHTNARYYNSDKPIEERNFNFYAKKMGIL